VREVVTPSCNGVPGVLPRKFLRFCFICQTVHFGEYLCNKWAHFAVLNTDVVYESTFFTKQIYNVVREILT